MMKQYPRPRKVLFAAALLGSLFLLGGAFPAASEDLPYKSDLPVIMRGYYNARPIIGGCQVFPADNVWNTRVDHLPVDANSSAYINSAGLGAARGLHADFGSGVWPEGSTSPIGIPFVVVPAGQAAVTIHYTDYGDESDPGPYPVPRSAPIEGGPSGDGDRHVLVVRSGECKLYELYSAYPNADGSWDAASGAVYNLRANGPLRPAGWTSADAAGLPILPGLVRYDEVAEGEIRHALRFTGWTYGNYVWPARHRADNRCSGTYCPKMGQRFRLKSTFNVASAPTRVRVILIAMQQYGLIMADNGSPWYISGVPDERWDNDELRWLGSYVHGSDFEAVNTSGMMIDPNSGQARQP